MKKCAPISKGAGKRKATLKAKEKLRLTVEGEVSTTDDDDDDDDDDDGIGGVRGGIHIVHVDNIVGGGVSGMCEKFISRSQISCPNQDFQNPLPRLISV